MSRSKCGTMVLVVLLGVLIGMFSCFQIKNFLDQWFDFPSPDQTIMQDTQLIMQAVSTHTGEPVPTEMPAHLRYVTVCWDMLQQVMQENNFQYEIVIASIIGDWGTPKAGGTGATEASVNVVFPDGRMVKLYYYAYWLESCTLSKKGADTNS